MRLQDVHIAGAGMYLPPPLTVEEAIRSGQCDEAVRTETSVTAVRVAGSVSAPELAARASAEALRRSGHAAEEIDAFFYSNAWHQGPDGWSPQYFVLREALGTDVPAFEVRQGCNGVFAAMDLAACYLNASPERGAALIAAADNWGTPLVDRWRSAPGSALGDGATALVVSKRPGFAEVLSLNLGSVTELEEVDRFGEDLFPPACTVGKVMDHRTRSRRYLESFETRMPPIVTLTPAATVKAVERTLEEAGVGAADVTRVCHVNVSEAYLRRFVFAPLGLSADIGTFAFGQGNGHMAANDVFSSFVHVVETGQVRAGDNVLLFGTAPGQSIAAALVRITGEPGWEIPAEGR
ncbi:ketoacyl-ACP synthase III family protein [Sphaerisporangium corydalis]|uniref:Ketoacyl-ACP synthase III family protein n=1 Tax=Sphaerisporangium corydalis TaxID=1441875 RepID=A0ABV9EGN5_9ACTN|nr:ketoacyl-ACP synthase III family protein [Sphaerisporangium corydalis]